MMIAAVRVVEHSGAENDGGTHTEEGDKASQYPDHCKPPMILFSNFLDAEIVSIETFHCAPLIGDWR
jgi:hypothetical protein